jgi:hypothetical protein
MKIEKVLNSDEKLNAVYENGTSLPVLCWAVVQERKIVHGDVELVSSIVGMVPHGPEVVPAKDVGNFIEYEHEKTTAGDR